MGEQAAVNSRVSPVKAGTSPRPVRLGIDVPMLLSVAFLLGFGLLMVYSASWQPSMLREEEPAYYLIAQLKWVVIGVAGATLLMYIDYRRWRKFIVPIMFCLSPGCRCAQGPQPTHCWEARSSLPNWPKSSSSCTWLIG